MKTDNVMVPRELLERIEYLLHIADMEPPCVRDLRALLAQPASDAVAYLVTATKAGHKHPHKTLEYTSERAELQAEHWRGVGCSVTVRPLGDLCQVCSPAPAVPDGWQLVPVEPTPEMQWAGAEAIRIETTAINKLWTGNAVFRAMVAAAAPAAPGVE